MARGIKHLWVLVLFLGICHCPAPLKDNTFTTNSPGKFPKITPSTTANSKIVGTIDNDGTVYSSDALVFNHSGGTANIIMLGTSVTTDTTNGILILDPTEGGAQILMKAGDISLTITNGSGVTAMDAAAYVTGAGKNVFYLVSGLDGNYGDTMGFDPSGDALIAAPIFLGTTFSNVIASASILAAIHNAHTNLVTVYGSGIMAVGGLIVTNGDWSATNVWSGATNSVDMSINDQYFTTLTPCQISGIFNKSNSLSSQVTLTILNNSSTNITVTYGSAGFVDRDHTTSQVITNATVGIFWIKHTPALGGHTNVVFNDF